MQECENQETTHVELDRSLMQLIKHNCRRDQSYSNYILELIEYKETHDRNE